jgi:hypothetical protein
MIRPCFKSCLAAGATFGLCLLGLAQSPTPPTVAPSTPSATTNAAAVSTTTNAPISALQIDPETRELRPRDAFRYRIHEDPVGGSDSLRTSITDSGEAIFNVSRGDATYITIKAAGRHLAEIRADLKQRLEAEYYVVATIDLNLESIALPQGGTAEIGGGVTTQSTFPTVVVFDAMQGEFAIPDGQPLMLSTIMLKLPSNQFANRKKVEIQRVGPDGKALPPIKVNVDDLLLNNNRSADVELKGGDRIRVPRKVIFGL